MKILYVITKSNWGGAQRYTYDLATEMAKYGHDVTVAAGGTGEYNSGPGKLAEMITSAGVRFLFLPDLGRDISFLKEIKVLLKLVKLFRKERPHAVHVNSSKIGGLGTFAGRLAGVRKIIFTAHGFAIDEDRPLYQKWTIAFLSWLTVMFSTDTIIITEKDSARIKSWPFITDKKIHLIKNGIQAPEFLPREEARQALQEKIGAEVSPDSLLIGSVGELHPNKNFNLLIEAFAPLATQHENARLIIIGDGESKSELAALINKLNVSPNVFLPGFLESASKYLKAFDIFVLPSKKEGLPYVLIEAGFAGLPVIASSVGAIPELLKSDRGVLVEPNNNQKLQEALQSLISNPEKRTLLGTNLLKEVTKQYTQEKMVGDTIVVYNE